MYENADQAKACVENFREYRGAGVKPELSPVTDFTDGRCHQYDGGVMVLDISTIYYYYYYYYYYFFFLIDRML